MVTLGNLRQLYGDVVETATIVRSLLAAVASQLSGDPSDLHRRCVLGYCLGCFRKPGEADLDPATFGAFDAADVHADLAPFGAIEAVAACGPLFYAAVVFRDESSVAVALRRQAETSSGMYSAVPPLDRALPLRCMPPEMIKVALNPPPPPPPSAAPRPLRPLHSFRNYPGEPPLNPDAGAPGTTEFWPSDESQVYGPAVAVDGTLWMNGHLVYNYSKAEGKGVRVDPAWIRVVRIDRPDAYAGGPPTFVPYVCYC